METFQIQDKATLVCALVSITPREQGCLHCLGSVMADTSPPCLSSRFVEVWLGL